MIIETQAKTANRLASAVRASLPDVAVTARSAGQGLVVNRRHSTPGVHPFDEVKWELRSAAISSETGDVVFKQDNVVVSKYFRGGLDTPERERSAKQLIGRVVTTLTRWGREGGYFADEASAEAFEAELTHLLVNH